MEALGPNVIRMSKSKSTRWAVHIVNMGEIRTKYVSENLKGRVNLGDLGVDERMILRCNLRK
jgi:hypothetical protein